VQKEVGHAHSANRPAQIVIRHLQVTTYYNVPPLRVPHLVLREGLLARLEAAFERSTLASSRSIVVLFGTSGAGKTQLVLEYCRRMKARGLRAILWVDASSRKVLYSGMEMIAKQLMSGGVLDDRLAAVTLVKDVLSSWDDAWLMVFDNLDNPSDIPDILHFFPDSRCGSILVTSRFAGSKELGQLIEVDCMEKEEGRLLLLHCSETDSEELAAVEQILTQVGYLALAIDQVRAYISRRQLRFTTFVKQCEARKRSIMQETPLFWQYRRTLPDTTEETALSLWTTWEMLLALLDADERHTAKLTDILTLFAFFHPVSISETLFSNSQDDPSLTTSVLSVFNNDNSWDHFKFEEAVVKMQELSMLRSSHRNEDEIVVSLHSMVSDWLRMRLNNDRQFTFLTTAVSQLQQYLDSTSHMNYTTRREALSHMDAICRVAEFNKRDSFSEACVTFGTFYADQGRLVDAEAMYHRALAGYEKALGPEHKSTLNTVNNLGNLYANQGCLVDAEAMYPRALAGYEKALGPEHTSTLLTVNNLGLLYANQGRLEDAEATDNRALAGYEKAPGPEHTSTLNTVDNLGVLYASQGRLVDAEAMYNRVLAGYEKALGPEHTSTLNTVNNLGVLYVRQGRLEDAEAMYNRALAGYENALGPEHTSTLLTANNLGNLYADQGRLEDAEAMYNCALAGFPKALGHEHTS
jgi:tetratricopeptide (TPR) repeat protein